MKQHKERPDGAADRLGTPPGAFKTPNIKARLQLRKHATVVDPRDQMQEDKLADKQSQLLHVLASDARPSEANSPVLLVLPTGPHPKL